MGYWIRKLKNLPNTLDWYLFLVGDYRNHSIINDFFRDDFCIIAERIGENAGIVSQNDSLERDLQKSLIGRESGSLGIMFKNLEKRKPGLLILNKHPKNLYHFNEFIEDKKENLPDGLNSYQQEQYLMETYDENRRKYNKLQKDEVIIYIPFETLEKVYSNTNELIVDIVDFVKNENRNLVKKTSKVGRVKNNIDVSASVGINLGIIAINFEV